MIIGIDGGGSKTVAWLCHPDGAEVPIGVGQAGPSNPQSVGFGVAVENVLAAVRGSITSAAVDPAEVTSICAALAGAGREEVRDRVRQRLVERNIATHVQVVHDGAAVLAAETSHGWGVALIAGTGSFAYGASPVGETARVGGWGYLLGDEGSGYWIGLEGLKAVARAHDGRGPATTLTQRLLRILQRDTATELVQVAYAEEFTRRDMAALAETVLEAAAENDIVAVAIVEKAGEELARLAQLLIAKLQLTVNDFPLALAGGILTGNPILREKVLSALSQEKIVPHPVTVVSDPVLGAVRLARRLV